VKKRALTEFKRRSACLLDYEKAKERKKDSSGTTKEYGEKEGKNRCGRALNTNEEGSAGKRGEERARITRRETKLREGDRAMPRAEDFLE